MALAADVSPCVTLYVSFPLCSAQGASKPAKASHALPVTRYPGTQLVLPVHWEHIELKCAWGCQAGDPCAQAAVATGVDAAGL